VRFQNTYEVHTDGGDITFGVGVIGKTQQQARLSDTGVTDEEKLEQVVVSIAMVRYCRRVEWRGAGSRGPLRKQGSDTEVLWTFGYCQSNGSPTRGSHIGGDGAVEGEHVVGGEVVVLRCGWKAYHSGFMMKRGRVRPVGTRRPKDRKNKLARTKEIKQV
jgi:hypothetical protein